MTKEEIIEHIAQILWLSGMGSRKAGLNFATEITERLIAKGILKVSE